ncbi:MAG: DUF4403 family protein [bacterium]|nr:DUF4403 family protein [bacterium]
MHLRILFTIILLFGFISCSKTNESSETDQQVTNTYVKSTVSQLSFPLDFPASELTVLVNKLMPSVLVDEKIKLKKKGDYLKLRILPIGKVLLNVYGNNLDISLPIKVEAVVNKKVVGVDVKNKKPITFEMRVDLHTELSIDNNWQLQATCKLQETKWITEPDLKIAGVSVNLKNVVDNAISKKQKKIEELICETLTKVVPIKKQVSKIWEQLNIPHRVGKKPVEIWLATNPKSFVAEIDKKVKGVVRVNIFVESEISISPVNENKASGTSLPENKKLKSQQHALDMAIKLMLPFDYMDNLLKERLQEVDLTYQGFEVEIQEIKTDHFDNKIRIQFSLKGAVDADVKALAIPVLDEDQNLRISDISFEFNSDNPLVYLTDQVFHSALNDYLVDNTTISLEKELNSIDQKIMEALNNSKVGEKIEMDLELSTISSDTLLFYKDRLEWWFNVDGTTRASLNSNIVN